MAAIFIRFLLQMESTDNTPVNDDGIKGKCDSVHRSIHALIIVAQRLL